MNWRLVAIPVTLIPIFIIAIQFDIKLADILAIGVYPFIGAIAVMMIKLCLQGVKFAYITRKYLGNFDSFFKLVGVRVGSEFIKFTTPMFIGAEFVVIYYLKKKGVEAQRCKSCLLWSKTVGVNQYDIWLSSQYFWPSSGLLL